jgi:glycosyl transferase, family 25
MTDLNSYLKDFFDRVFVLTVPRFKERQEKVTQNLSGISFDFFFGKDKQEIDEEFIHRNYHYDKKNSLALRQHFPELNKGEIACAISHRMMYEAMVKNNWKHVLIFEDDVVPAEDISGLASCLNQLPEDWDLLYLGYLKNEEVSLPKKIQQAWYILQARFGFSRMSIRMIRRRLPRPYSSHLKRAGFHDCTHAYAISLGGAKKLIAAQNPVIYRADNLLSALVLKNELNAFICHDQYFNQEIFTDATHRSHVRKQSF